MPMTDREFLRHIFATIAYRTAKAVRGAPESFATFKAGPTSRTPQEILAHMGDLFDWTLTMIAGAPKWHGATPLDWPDECERFFEALKKCDNALASDVEIAFELTRMFQGPIADSLTHTGQLAMLRRLHGSPIKGEGYPMADIRIGRVGFEQTPANPRYEFD